VPKIAPEKIAKTPPVVADSSVELGHLTVPKTDDAVR
jgi:hypothetical protein